MTNHWTDIANADVVMIAGANPASNHPVAFKHILEARRRGAKIITIDPRYTRSANRSDLYCKLRPGTDIAFVNGMIRYAIRNGKYHEDYVKWATNASFLLSPDFELTDGVFSGFDAGKRTYDQASWAYQKDEAGLIKSDPTLQDPRCVFKVLEAHVERYTPEAVAATCGCDRKDFLAVAEAFCETGRPDKSGTLLYAMGLTQHTVGSQNVRVWAILQTLLGNMGVAGGGINAMRGESNVQGSTDFGLLYHILPGYLQTPVAADRTLADYLKRCTPTTKDPTSANWWQNYPKYIVSHLKAMYGAEATRENDFRFDWLPRRSGNQSHMAIFEDMGKGRIKGAFFFGQNPAVGGPDANRETQALTNLEWMVAVDLWETETANFWHHPYGGRPADVKTEVFLLPASASFEKEGSISNSGRWVQWRHKAVKPLGMARSDLWILDQLAREIRRVYRAEGGAFPDPVVNLAWNYEGGEEGIDVHKVAREINGYDETSKKQVPGFAALKDDGSTVCGNWLYAGSYTEAGNMMARRDPTDAPNKIGLYPKWAWCWPVNRRIIYNRASCNPDGVPWNPAKWVVKWDPAANEGKGGWLGDVPDGPWPPRDKRPFIMRPEGVACLFATGGMVDGPLPEHYEPMESPVRNQVSRTQTNPVAALFQTPEQNDGNFEEYLKKYPVIGTTHRLSEHWQAGQMTRNISLLNELMPSMFVMMSPELAKRLAVKNGDPVVVTTARGDIEARAHVTARIRAFDVGEKTVEVITLPWHFGFIGESTGALANRLTGHWGDANTSIPEYKVFLCDVKKGGVA